MSSWRWYLFFLSGIVMAILVARGQQSSDSFWNHPDWQHLSSVKGDLPAPNTGNQQTASLVLDVDQDGINDFIITERTESPSVVWYRRRGDGWERYIVEEEALRVEAGGACHDISGDGYPDVVFGGDGRSNEVWWWENPGPDYDSGVPWRRRVIKQEGENKHHDQLFGDFDGDGEMELVFWNQGGRRLYLAEIPEQPAEAVSWDAHVIYSYSDDSEMQPRGIYPGWRRTHEHEGLAKADIDGDGKLDIVGGGRWFKHQGGRDFSVNIVDASYTFTRAATAQLIEGRRPEIVLLAGDGKGPLMMYQWQEGVWAGTPLIDQLQDGHSLDIIDFDADGRLDIFVAEMQLGENPIPRALILRGDGKGGFTTTEILRGYGLHEARIADLTGDGRLDILAKPYTWQAPRLDVWVNQGSEPVTSTGSGWWNPAWPYRLPLALTAGEHESKDKVVEVELDFMKLLQEVGDRSIFAPDSIRVIEVDAAGSILNENVVFQFFRKTDSDLRSKSSGRLIFLADGTTKAGAARYYHVYYGTRSGDFTAPSFPPLVRVEDQVQHQEQESFRIMTPAGTYLYHKKGAGFAGLIDPQGNDWISYRPGGASAGEYRGIPNLVHPQGHFHPGSRTASSRLLSRGPLLAVIYSETNDGQWACQWNIYPEYARMTLLQAGGPYWFLYEGTPGGRLDVEGDFVVRSTGEKTSVSEDWAQPIRAPRWVYFGSANSERVLFVANHQDEGQVDQFWQMQGNMTVFGFGREYRCCEKYLTSVPAKFTIGLVASRDFKEVSSVIHSTSHEVQVRAGQPEAFGIVRTQ